MSKGQMKLTAILLIICVGLIAAIIYGVADVAGSSATCQPIAGAFVDIDRDSDIDYLVNGCIIINPGPFNTGEINGPDIVHPPTPLPPENFQ